MGCCGDKRKAVRRAVAATPPREPPRVSASVPLAFLGSGAYLVSGPQSRRIYTFSSDEPEQLVEQQDARALIRTGLFRACT